MVLKFASVTSLHSCVKLGLGLTLCPNITAAKALDQGKLIQLHCEVLPDSTSIIMIWHSQKWCSPVLRQFLDLAGEMI